MDQLKIICLSVDFWDELFKRKQRIMLELSKYPTVSSVLYVDPPLYRNIVQAGYGYLRDKLKLLETKEFSQAGYPKPLQVAERCWVYRSVANLLPLSRFKRLKQLNRWIMYKFIQLSAKNLPGDNEVLWLYDPFDWQIVNFFPRRKLVCFDWTDDWAAFENPTGIQNGDKSIADQTQSVVQSADLVFTVSESLFNQAVQHNPEGSRFTPNATDYETLSSSRDITLPIATELANIKPPIIGYVGQIRDDRIDIELARQIAEMNPNWSFVYIGPIIEGDTFIKNMKNIKNVHLIGKIPFIQIADYLRGIDVFIIPHQVNRLVLSMDPIKLYDYMASGKPTVTTPIVNCDTFKELVYFASDVDSFTIQIEKALCEKDANLSAKRMAFAQQNSWEMRVADIHQHLQTALLEVDLYP